MRRTVELPDALTFLHTLRGSWSTASTCALVCQSMSSHDFSDLSNFSVDVLRELQHRGLFDPERESWSALTASERRHRLLELYSRLQNIFDGALAEFEYFDEVGEIMQWMIDELEDEGLYDPHIEYWEDLPADDQSDRLATFFSSSMPLHKLNVLHQELENYCCEGSHEVASSRASWRTLSEYTSAGERTTSDTNRGASQQLHHPSAAVPLAFRVLDAAVAHLPQREDRGGQRRMCEQVLQALLDGEDLAVRAGPLTGKTLAYALAAAVHALTVTQNKPIVIACASLAAQDQLMSVLSTVRVAVSESGLDELRYGALKGRNNYLCQEQLANTFAQPEINEDWKAYRDPLRTWSHSTETGDLKELFGRIPSDLLRHVSGAHCSHASISSPHTAMPCYANIALLNASQHHVLVTNHHKYVWHLKSSNAILPDHDIVIIDEADFLLDIVSSVSTHQLTLNDETIEAVIDVGRAVHLPRAVRADLRRALGSTAYDPNGNRVLDVLRSRLHDPAVMVPTDLSLLPNVERLVQLVRDQTKPHYMFLRQRSGKLKLCVTLLDPLRWLEQCRSPDGQLIMCSSTLTSSSNVSQLDGLDRRHALHEPSAAEIYERQALLYVPNDMPDPVGDPLASRVRAFEELLPLIEAAGGRTLILSATTQDRNDIYDLLKVFEERMDTRLLRQGDMPPLELLDCLRADKKTVICAVKQLWTGIDVPGDALQLVIVDTIPFGNPSRPLVWSDDSWAPVDHGDHYAERMLAQAAHRLIRTRSDRGVMALLDSRYWDSLERGRNLLRLAPPMKLTSNPQEAVNYLRELRRA